MLEAVGHPPSGNPPTKGVTRASSTRPPRAADARGESDVRCCCESSASRRRTLRPSTSRPGRAGRHRDFPRRPAGPPWGSTTPPRRRCQPLPAPGGRCRAEGSGWSGSDHRADGRGQDFGQSPGRRTGPGARNPAPRRMPRGMGGRTASPPTPACRSAGPAWPTSSVEAGEKPVDRTALAVTLSWRRHARARLDPVGLRHALDGPHAGLLPCPPRRPPAAPRACRGRGRCLGAGSAGREADARAGVVQAARSGIDRRVACRLLRSLLEVQQDGRLRQVAGRAARRPRPRPCAGPGRAAGCRESGRRQAGGRKRLGDADRPRPGLPGVLQTAEPHGRRACWRAATSALRRQTSRRPCAWGETSR